MPPPDAILVIDVGSTSVGVSAWQQSGAQTDPPTLIQELAVVSTDLQSSGPDVLRATIEEAIDVACIRLESLKVVISEVSISSFGMALIGLDKAGGALAFATYLGICHRYGGCARSLPWETAFQEQDAADRLGCPKPWHPSFALHHLSTLDPGSVHRLTTLVSFLLERWCGMSGLPISYSEASWWGMLNWKNLTFDDRAMEASGFPSSSFPKLADSSDLKLELSAIYSARWPCLADARFNLAIVDGACAAIGSGPVGSLGCTIGTSAAMRIVVPRNSVQSVPLGCFGFVVSRNLLVLGGALTDGGAAVHLFARLFRIDLENKDTELANMPLPTSVICLPFFSASGERAPGWAGSRVPGMVANITQTTTADEILLAIYCGVAARLSRIADLLAQFVQQRYSGRLFVSGTAILKGRTWQRVVSSSCRATLATSSASSDPQLKDLTTSMGSAMIISSKFHTDTSQIRGLSSFPSYGDAEIAFPEILRKQDVLYDSVLQRNLPKLYSTK